MSPKAKLTLNRIVLFVHPFHAVFMPRDAYDQIEIPDKRTRENISFLLGVWANEARKAARNPKTMLILVEPPLHFEERSPQQEWFIPKWRKFISYLQKEFGPRLFLAPYTLELGNIKNEMRKRGFKTSNELQGRAFGANVAECLETQMLKLYELFPTKMRKLEKIKHLSTDYKRPSTPGVIPYLGERGLRRKSSRAFHQAKQRRRR